MADEMICANGYIQKGGMGMIERELNGVEVSIPRRYQEAIIVRPEDPKTETLVWLRVDGDKVAIDFPEKDEDFREIVRGLNYRWQETEWARIIGARAGDPIHRVAELGRTLLAKGFSVVFPDELMREMAVSGEYEPECPRQVLARTSGEHEGWFVLWWMYKEDCYDAAKQITASRYDKPNVVVPPEQFEEVIDFAKIHKFRFSQGAFELVAQAKAMRESALVVSVEEKGVDWSDEDLNIPTLGWEDDDLDDDIGFDASPDTAA